MSLIAICCHSTEENDRLRYTKECLNSIMETVNWDKHRLFVINNASSEETKEFLQGIMPTIPNATLINLSENIGTARGINMALKFRKPKENCVKADDDVVWYSKGWVEEMEKCFKQSPTIGICGLKRKDVWQNPDHPNLEYRTVIEKLPNDVELEICNDIMGTCTMFNHLLLDKIGYMNQPSSYGFDDVLISVRSVVAGFKNCFLPHIKIEHIDDGLNPYCDWKKKEAGVYLREIGVLCDMYKSGQLDYYWDGGFDD